MLSLVMFQRLWSTTSWVCVMSTWEARAPSCLRSEAGVYGEYLEVYRKYLEVYRKYMEVRSCNYCLCQSWYHEPKITSKNVKWSVRRLLHSTSFSITCLLFSNWCLLFECFILNLHIAVLVMKTRKSWLKIHITKCQFIVEMVLYCNY